MAEGSGIAKPPRIRVPCGLRFTAISGRPLLVGVDQREPTV